MLRRSRSFDLLVFSVSAAAGDRGAEPEAPEVWQELKDGHWQLVRTEWRNALERLGKNQIRVEQENNGNKNPDFPIPLATSEEITPRPITPTFGYTKAPTQCRFVASRRRPSRRLLVTSRREVSWVLAARRGLGDSERLGRMSVIIVMRRSFTLNWRHEGGSLVFQRRRLVGRGGCGRPYYSSGPSLRTVV